jgi:hypothetical protein
MLMQEFVVYSKNHKKPINKLWTKCYVLVPMSTGTISIGYRELNSENTHLDVTIAYMLFSAAEGITCL